MIAMAVTLILPLLTAISVKANGCGEVANPAGSWHNDPSGNCQSRRCPYCGEDAYPNACDDPNDYVIGDHQCFGIDGWTTDGWCPYWQTDTCD